MTEEFEQQYIFDDNEPALELKLVNFNGPLDLLLELVKANKIEIKDIFVSQVTEQFLQYMDQLSEIDVNKAAEYMAMAATLLEIKARALIPVLEELNDEESPEKVLIRQLEEYKVFKEVLPRAGQKRGQIRHGDKGRSQRGRLYAGVQQIPAENAVEAADGGFPRNTKGKLFRPAKDSLYTRSAQNGRKLYVFAAV